MTKRKSVGRPRQEAEPGERAQLSFRVTAELKGRSDAAADQSGRSQSQEAEFRLERSFDHQDLLSEALTLAYGRKLAGIIMALGFVMDGAARGWDFRSNASSRDWTDEPELFELAIEAACTLLNAARPKGTPETRAAFLSEGYGCLFTGQFLHALRGDKPDYPGIEQGEQIKRLLGPMAERMSVNHETANPLHLAIAVMSAGAAMEEFAKTHSSPFEPEPVAKVLERHLKEFLARDWKWRKLEDKPYEQPSATGQKLEATILQFRRSA